METVRVFDGREHVIDADWEHGLSGSSWESQSRCSAQDEGGV